MSVDIEDQETSRSVEMHQIRYFLAVAETLNFTRAAEHCGVRPPSLIRAIKLLEAEFGGALFNRERSRTHLTELGRIALPYLQQIAASAARAKTEAARSLTLDRVDLKLGIMCTIAPKAFLDFLSQFRMKYPAVTLTIIDENAKALQDLVLAGELDIAVYASPGRLPDKRLHIRPLFSEEMVIVLSEKHDLARKATLSPSDLDGLPYVERINCEFAEYGEEVFTDNQIHGPTVCRSERDDWVLGMVAQNFGYGFMPLSAAHHSGTVVRRIENMPLSRTVNIVTVRGRPFSSVVGALMRQLSRVKLAPSAAL